MSRELTGQYVVPLYVPSGRIAGGHTARHFLDLADLCEEAGEEELAAEIRDALARNDGDALRAIADAECEGLEVELAPDDDGLYEEIDNNPVVVQLRPSYGTQPPVYSSVCPMTSRRRSGRAPRGRRVVRRVAGSRDGPHRRSSDDDPHDVVLAGVLG